MPVCQKVRHGEDFHGPEGGSAVVTVWLWKSGTAEGVTGDEKRARQLAESFMGVDTATALVKSALFISGPELLADSYYQPLGTPWSARRGRDGQVQWRLTASPKLAAS